MLVCNVSLRPPGRAIAADIAETAVAADNLGGGSGQVVFATLVDDPASVGEIVDAYLGEIMLEAASAADTIDGSLPQTYLVDIAEAGTAAESATGTVTPAVTSTWNPADKSAAISLSGGNLTASAGAITNGTVRATTSQSTGKLYFEVTYGASIDAATAFGLGQPGASLPFFRNSAGTTAISGDGGIYVNGGLSFGIGAAPGSAVGCIAVDLGAKLVWFRFNAGNWNGGSSNNPATGTGGLSIAALSLPLMPFFVVNNAGSTQTATANFGGSTFAQSVPSGFTAWG